MSKKSKLILNTEPQYYRGIRIRLIDRNYSSYNAKRYMLGDEQYNQNIWIPNIYLEDDGTLKPMNIDFIFRKAFYQKKFEYAHLEENPLNWR